MLMVFNVVAFQIHFKSMIVGVWWFGGSHVFCTRLQNYCTMTCRKINVCSTFGQLTGFMHTIYQNKLHKYTIYLLFFQGYVIP